MFAQFIIFLIILQAMISPVQVTGNSMSPTLQDGEYLTTTRITCHKLHNGDIVVFEPPQAIGFQFIKRVIALPRQTIKIDNGIVYLDGQELTEDYLPQIEQFTAPQFFLQNGEELTLGENEFFVMGDNRPNSSDSRAWGPVPCDNLVSKLP